MKQILLSILLILTTTTIYGQKLKQLEHADGEGYTIFTDPTGRQKYILFDSLTVAKVLQFDTATDSLYLLTKYGDTLSSVSLSSLANQSLSYSTPNDIISLTGGGSIDITEVNTDDQTLSVSGSSLSISGGNTVTLPSGGGGGGDPDQTLSYTAASDVISISGGNAIDITEVNTDDQTLSFNTSNQNLSIGGGNTISLSTLLNTNTDNQNLSLSGNNLNISGGSGVSLANYTQSLGYNNSTNLLTLSNGGGSINRNDLQLDQLINYSPTTKQISLSSSEGAGVQYVNIGSLNTDDQILSLSGSSLSISGGNTVTIPTGGDPDQSLSYTTSTDVISISGGNSIDITEVNTDTQNLSYNTSTDVISLTNGGSIDITEVDTDDQTLSVSGSSLSISGGNSVTLPSGGGGDPDQTLSYSGAALSISGGNTVSLPWTKSGVNIYTDGGNDRVGIRTNNPTQNLHVDGSVRIEGGLYDRDNWHGTSGTRLYSGGLAGVSWEYYSYGSTTGNSSQTITTSNTTLTLGSGGQAYNMTSGSNELTSTHGGVYLVNFQTEVYYISSTANIKIQLYKNGSAFGKPAYSPYVSSTNYKSSVSTIGMITLFPGDGVSVRATIYDGTSAKVDEKYLILTQVN